MFDGRIFITNYYKTDSLKEFGRDGNHIRVIPLSDNAWSVVDIDNTRLAVTFGLSTQ